METIISLLNVAIWPLTIFIILFIFRTEFRKILSRLSHFKYKGIEANFTHQIEKAENTANIINIHQSKLTEIVEEEDDYNKSQLSRISEISPRAAIFESWFNVEHEIKNLANSLDIEFSNKSHDLKIMQTLKEREIIDDSTMELYHRLKKIRNDAVHVSDIELDTLEAGRYLNLSKGLIAYLKFTISNYKE